MTYKEKIRNLIRLARFVATSNRKSYKEFVKFNLGFWNANTEAYYTSAILYTYANDTYQKSDKYREYRREYERSYRKRNKASRSADVIISTYKKKYGDDWMNWYKLYLEKKKRKETYVPMFLPWCKTYDEEVQELYDLIKANPLDVTQLKQDYKKLTGKNFYSKRD